MEPNPLIHSCPILVKWAPPPVVQYENNQHYFVCKYRGKNILFLLSLEYGRMCLSFRKGRSKNVFPKEGY